MKNRRMPAHKIVGVLLLIGIWFLAQSKLFAQVSLDYQWRIRGWAFILCRMSIYGTLGIVLALLATDGHNVGFRVHPLPLTFGILLFVYCFLLVMANYVWPDTDNRFSEWFVELGRQILNRFDPTLLAANRLSKVIDSNGNYTSFLTALRHILDLLTGFCLTRGIFGTKETPVSDNEKEVSL